MELEGVSKTDYARNGVLTYLLHGAESFLSSWLACSSSRNSPHFTEPEGSLPHSQASATCLYPGPAQSGPHAHRNGVTLQKFHNTIYAKLRKKLAKKKRENECGNGWRRNTNLEHPQNTEERQRPVASLLQKVTKMCEEGKWWSRRKGEKEEEMSRVLLSFFLSFFLSFSATAPQWARASSFTRFLDHTQRRSTVSRTSLDEWSARRRDLDLTTHNIHNRQTSMPPVGFEPTISAGEGPQI